MGRDTIQLHIPRLLAFALAVCVLFSCIPAVSAAETGQCGENLSWSYSGGILTITGSGAMTDYSQQETAPWYEFRDRIAQVSLPDGMTTVGSYAFYECSALEMAALPDTVTRVGEFAFFDCSAMTHLDLGERLEVIERDAFERCGALTMLELPYGLQSIGGHAFWRCESLIAVTVPRSVTFMGPAVFAYCKSMVRADIQALITSLPEWTFYGCNVLSTVALPDHLNEVRDDAFLKCESLSQICYQGRQNDAANILSALEPEQDAHIVPTMPDSSASSQTWTDEQNQYVQTDMVTQTDNATVGTTMVHTSPKEQDETPAPSSTQITINSTVSNADGWQEVVDQAEYVLNLYENRLEQDGTKLQIHVTLESDVPVNAEQLKELSGRPVELTVKKNDGSSWTIHPSELERESLEGDYDLGYTLTRLEGEEYQDAEWYELRFANDVDVKTDVLIRIPTLPARKPAYLYQMKGGQRTLLQSVLSDDEGYVRFYLAGVDNETEYRIGISVPGESTDQLIIPAQLHEQFDITDTMAPIDYQITGVNSSWNMDIKQVTWIMVGVLGGSVALIGVVVYLLNKRKLKNGYVPDLDEYDYE